jgi:ABC-type transport system involved in multi-copper enzyme maturation permease subunit
VVLCAVVMSVLLAATIRAQLISTREAGTSILWIGGFVLTGFLAIGPIGSERATGTWRHLRSLPVPGAAVILAKWLFGVRSVAGIVLLATLAGWLAGRGLFVPTQWLLLSGVLAAFALGGWYTVLLLATLRSRNEYEAAMMVLCVSIIGVIWFLVVAVQRWGDPFLSIPVIVGMAHPLACGAYVSDIRTLSGTPGFLVATIIVSAVLWWIGPVVVLGWLSRRSMKTSQMPEARS